MNETAYNSRFSQLRILLKPVVDFPLKNLILAESTQFRSSQLTPSVGTLAVIPKNMKKINIIIILFCFFNSLQAQKKFKIETKETETWRSIHIIKDEKGNLIKQLDSSKYSVSFNDDSLRYFAVFVIKNNKGWLAIDSNEKILFEVYNQGDEINPDNLIENKIRIVDENQKIGFANEKGKIIIKPQFEIVTQFYNGKAIIAENCEKIPWNAHAEESDCHHHSIECKKYGYINKRGKIIELGNYTFEEIQKKINWKQPE